MTSIGDLKKMLEGGGISLEEYHYWFPKMMESKYEFGNFGLYSFQLDLGENPNLVCANHSIFNLEKSSQEVVQRKGALDLALALNKLRPTWYAELDDTKEDDLQQKVLFFYHLIEESLGTHGIRHGEAFWWGDFFEDHLEPVDDYSPEFLKQYPSKEIALRFAESIQGHLGDVDCPTEAFAKDLEEYLSPLSGEPGGREQFKMNFHFFDGNAAMLLPSKIFMLNQAMDSMVLLIGGTNSQNR